VATGIPGEGSPASRTVTAGWVLIGQYQEFDQTKAQAFDTVTTGVNFETNVVYSMTPSGLVVVTTLQPGYGYWAFADAAGTYAEGAAEGTP